MKSFLLLPHCVPPNPSLQQNDGKYLEIAHELSLRSSHHQLDRSGGFVAALHLAADKEPAKRSLKDDDENSLLRVMTRCELRRTTGKLIN
jgi:hypothetical protein